MSIRKILVPITGGPHDADVLAMGLDVAKMFGAQAVALFARADPTEALPYLGEGVSGQVIEDLMDAAREGADLSCTKARKALEEAVAVAGLPLVNESSAANLPSARFVDVVGRRDDVVTAHSRLSDLVVFAEAEDSSPGGSSLEAALMSADRPVLIAPKQRKATIGTCVAIGWDQSQEASMAVTAAIPFLSAASKVSIFCIGSKELDPTPCDMLEDYLALHGLTAKINLVDGQGRPDGEVLLEQAEKISADLLVMGGYSHSRVRQFFLGGTTTHVRSHATIPVLMAH
ncbi:MAG: universal stress protein [Rhizobiales bacterium]|nr:universal stress protein [Hyphomicrobiales bacterium]